MREMIIDNLLGNKVEAASFLAYRKVRRISDMYDAGRRHPRRTEVA
jgi:hypothetical protein